MGIYLNVTGNQVFKMGKKIYKFKINVVKRNDRPKKEQKVSL